MWLVGYVYNHNGMGAWCIEAAHALAASGERVALVCAPDLALPDDLPFEVLRVRSIEYAPSLRGRLSEELHRMSTSGPRVMREAANRVASRGLAVRALLLNSTEFFDPAIGSPQLVTAWARGIHLRDYLGRLRTHLRGLSLHSVRMTLDAIGWWRRDWFAFRRAHVIAGVSQALTQELRDAGIDAQLLHPCIDVPAIAARAPAEGRAVRLLIAAESLGLPRKRVGWMLDALRGWSGGAVTLTLVGEPTDEIRAAALATGVSARFAGQVSRSDVQREMREADVFLFASLLDDWGYVLAEAMSQGMTVVAPRTHPFDEIVGEAGVLFRPGSTEAFRGAVATACASASGLGAAARARAADRFSRETFVRRVRVLVAASDVHVVAAPGAPIG